MTETCDRSSAQCDTAWLGLLIRPRRLRLTVLVCWLVVVARDPYDVLGAEISGRTLRSRLWTSTFEPIKA